MMNIPPKGISEQSVVQLVREAMKEELEKRQAQETKDVDPGAPDMGMTIDLSHRSIEKFPDEAVDIIKVESKR